MAGAPVGNRNAAKESRLLTSALRRELTQNPDDVTAVARKVIESAKAGEPWAVKELYDRVDGKPPQALTLAGDEDGNPIRHSLAVEYVKPNVDPAA